MKINSQKFGDFLSLINLGGDVLVTECVVRGDKDKLSITAKPAKNGFVIAHGELLGDFTEFGIHSIGNLPLFVKLVKSFTGDIEITKTASSFAITGKKVDADIKSPAVQFVKSEPETGKYDTYKTIADGNRFTLTPLDLAEFTSYYSSFGKDVTISGDKNDIKFNLTAGDDKLNLSLVVPETIKKFKVKISGFLTLIFGLLKDQSITVSANDGAAAILVSAKTNEYTIDYIVAPRSK